MYSNQLSDFFSKKITDNNGQCCSDINAGLIELFSEFNEQRPLMQSKQRYFVSELDEGYSDSVAYNSILSDENLWWWVLLCCRFDDALVYPKANTILPIFATITLNKTKQQNSTLTEMSSEEDSNVNVIVELN